MTFKFLGNLQYRFRLSIFGHDFFVGPWVNQPINIVETVPAETETYSLPDGFSAVLSESAGAFSAAIKWEGIQLDKLGIPATGSAPVNLSPTGGIQLTGLASVTA